MRPTQEQIAGTLKKRKAIADELRYWVEIYNKGGISFTDLLQARIAELDPTPAVQPDDEWVEYELKRFRRSDFDGESDVQFTEIAELRKVKP